MRTILLGMCTMIAAAGVAIISAQHHQGGHAAEATRSHALPHLICESHDEETAGAHHTALADALQLTGEQRTAIGRISAEACEAMAKYHEQILAVLTPEQRAKLREHHGAR